MDAAVVELDPLTDAVRAGAEDDYARLRACGRSLVDLAPRGVVVVGRGLDLAGARVDAPVGGLDAAVAAALADGLLGRPAGGCDLRVGEPEPLQPEEVGSRERLGVADRLEPAEDPVKLALEERVDILRYIDERLPRRRGTGVELAGAERLEVRLGERPADPHRLADRLHLRSQSPISARELLEGEARELHDDVVERRLEARGCRPRQVVRDLVERVADGEPRGDLRDRVAGRLRRERRGAGHARVHLDDAHVAGLAMARELDVRAAGVDADRADDRDGGVAQLLVRLVGQRHLRRDRDRVARVDAHRVEVLDRADDDDVVIAVADDFELELVPAADGLLDEHLADRRLGERRARSAGEGHPR